MRSRGLCVLALLCLHSSVFGQEPVDVQPGVLIFCDDPSVEKAVSSAVHKFNEKLTNGHKLALFQTLSASKSENGANSVYSLQFTTRRSDCLAVDKKPWTDCHYLPHGRKAPISCNATVHMSETDADTKQVDCFLDHVTPEKASCLGCPRDIDENSEDIKVPLAASIAKYNSLSNHTHLFTVNNVGPATTQVVAGIRYKVKFDMRKTKCAKAEHKDLNELCVYDEEDVVFVNCNSIVDVAPWRFEVPEVHLQCEDGEMPVTFSRRRPPGWSPLRTLLFEVPSNKPTAAPVASPKASAKKESSEEDNTGSKQTSATGAADEGNKHPFHCPSKPWKPFRPVEPPKADAPTNSTVEATSKQPAADATADATAAAP